MLGVAAQECRPVEPVHAGGFACRYGVGRVGRFLRFKSVDSVPVAMVEAEEVG